MLWASTSTKDPAFPDSYYLGRLAAPDTVDTVPERTLLALAEHGTLDDPLEPDRAAAQRALSAVADAGVDVDALAERLPRQGAGAFSADWTVLRVTYLPGNARRRAPPSDRTGLFGRRVVETSGGGGARGWGCRWRQLRLPGRRPAAGGRSR